MDDRYSGIVSVYCHATGVDLMSRTAPLGILRSRLQVALRGYGYRLTWSRDWDGTQRGILVRAGPKLRRPDWKWSTIEHICAHALADEFNLFRH